MHSRMDQVTLAVFTLLAVNLATTQVNAELDCTEMSVGPTFETLVNGMRGYENDESYCFFTTCYQGYAATVFIDDVCTEADDVVVIHSVADVNQFNPVEEVTYSGCNNGPINPINLNTRTALVAMDTNDNANTGNGFSGSFMCRETDEMSGCTLVEPGVVFETLVDGVRGYENNERYCFYTICPADRLPVLTVHDLCTEADQDELAVSYVYDMDRFSPIEMTKLSGCDGQVLEPFHFQHQVGVAVLDTNENTVMTGFSASFTCGVALPTATIEDHIVNSIDLVSQYLTLLLQIHTEATQAIALIDSDGDFPSGLRQVFQSLQKKTDRQEDNFAEKLVILEGFSEPQ